MREPCLLPCLGLIAGLTVARLFPEPGPGGLEALLTVLAVAGWFFVSARVKRALVFTGFAALGCALPLFHPAPTMPPIPGEGLTRVQGCVVEPAVFFEGRARFLVELAPGVRAQISHYPKEGAGPALRAGQVVELEARFRRPDRFRNPGSFDYPAYLARRDVHFLATAPANKPITVTGNCGSGFVRYAAEVRQMLLDRIDALHANDPRTAGLMQALLLGESKKVHHEWTDEFRETGTYHALVVSGQHVVVLTGCVMVALRFLLPRSMAILAAVLVAWIYALLAGASAPVLRSAAGLSLFMAASFFHRKGRLLNILAAVAMGYLLLDPEQLVEPSFQLSFLAVAAIGGLAEPVIERFLVPLREAARAPLAADPDPDPRVESIRIEWRLLAETLEAWLRIPPVWVLRPLAWGTRGAAAVGESLVLSALVQAAIALPSVVYFHRFSFTGLTANLVIGPLLGMAIPLGFASVLLNSAGLATVTDGLMNASIAAARWHQTLEPAWRIPDPPLWLALAFPAATLAAGVAWRMRRLRLAAMVAWGAMLAIMLWHPFAPGVTKGALELTAVDVGQGDGLLLTLPDGSLAAIDAGGFPSMGNNPQQARKPEMDLGEDVIAPYFWTRSIRRLDVIVLTHAHADHVGGAAALLRNFQPREIWAGLMPASDPAWKEIAELAQARGIRIRQPRAGEEWTFGGARFRALAPFPGDEPQERAHNNDSLVFTVAHGRHRFLLTGDAETGVEQRILEAGLAGPLDVLKVGHHGSRTSSTAEFLERVRPAVALISCGRQNGFRHPNPRVINRLAEQRTVVLRTDRDGMVAIRSDGQYLHIVMFQSF